MEYSGANRIIFILEFVVLPYANEDVVEIHKWYGNVPQEAEETIATASKVYLKASSVEWIDHTS